MRKKGSRNKGFWYRTGRGWYAGTEKLLDPEGHHIKNLSDKQAAEQAYHALMASGKPETKLAKPKGANQLPSSLRGSNKRQWENPTFFG
jgi:hypothetical protein